MYAISKRLIEELHSNDVKYCHWKSNLLLAEALSGYDDLDLLVNSSQKQLFEGVIKGLGFKEGENKSIFFEGVHHYYGNDRETGNILHLHVYYKIRTGPSWTKSIFFPFENYILDNVITHESGMRVPDFHIEYVMYLIRVMVKYSRINEYLLINKDTDRNVKELSYLKSNSSQDKVVEFTKKYFPALDLTTIEQCGEFIKKGGFLSRWFFGKKIKRKIKNYIKANFFSELLQNIHQFSYRLINKLILKNKKILDGSGKLVAITGLDATGKSTIGGEVHKWLGKNFTIRDAHFGKPPSAILTMPLNLCIKISRIFKSDDGIKQSVNVDGKKSLMYVFRYWALAYDRSVLMKRCRGYVERGAIVICDRYKSEDIGVMDSKRLIPENHRGVKRFLSKWENKLYDEMPIPDIITNLKVPVEVAIQRNEERIKAGKETAEFIKIRHEQNNNLNYVSNSKIDINTDDEYEKTVVLIKDKIWGCI